MRIFKTSLAVSLAVGTLIAGGPATADDHNWAGLYGGATAGYAFGSSDPHTTVSQGSYFANTSVPSIDSNGSPTLHPDGITGGLEGGFNKQTGNIVWGIETDVGAFDTHDSHTSGPVVYPCCSPTTYTIHQATDTDWLLTVRPRVGWATGNLLIYGTGGIAVTQVKYQEKFTDTFASALEDGSKSVVETGWILGAGAEYALASNWSLKGEYLFTNFNNLTTAAPIVPTDGASATAFHSANLSSNIVRVGFNYKF